MTQSDKSRIGDTSGQLGNYSRRFSLEEALRQCNMRGKNPFPKREALRSVRFYRTQCRFWARRALDKY